MSFNIEVQGGTSVRLPTAGKYCDRDIVITATGSDSEPVIQPLEVTENGTYIAPDGVDGYSPVTVNVAGSGGSSDLPAGYSRVDYIKFTGKQIVDTGIVCTQDSKIKAAFTRENSASHFAFGVASSDNTASVTAYFGGLWRFGNKSASKNIATNADMIYSCVLDSSEITATGSESSISGVNKFETVGSLIIGSYRGGNGTIGSAQFVGQILFLAIWQGEELALKLVPVTDGNVYRFFDMVSKSFFDSITDTPLDGGNL